MQEETADINLRMANCVMLLSQPNHDHHHHHQNQASSILPQYDIVVRDSSSPSRVFECKTCNRQFPSFQALGGHRASHKKPRVQVAGILSSPSSGSSSDPGSQVSPPPAKPPKAHECSVCGLEFAIGQALGGHMRRHRLPRGATSPAPAKRARALSLDLNLTPYENDVRLQLRLGATNAPSPSMVDFF